MNTSVRSPGGWAQLLNARLDRVLAIGAAATGLGVLLLFGTINSGQAEHFCEAALETQTGAGIVALSCRNPFQGTGAILLSDEQGVYFDEALTVAGTLDAGTALTAIASGSNVFDNLQLTGAPRFLSTSFSGSSTFRSDRIIRVASGAYLNFTFGATSGATLSGNDPGFARLKWFNCSDVASTVQC